MLRWWKTLYKIIWWQKLNVFVQKMVSEKWDDIYSGDGDNYKKIITVVLRIIQQSFLVISVSRKRWKDKLWVAKSWKRSIKRQNKLYKACLVPTSEQNYKRCKNYEIILPKCFKEAEIRYCDEMFDNHRNYVYNIWKTLKPIINP